ncbi:MAG: hypothetical protein K2P79_05870 [Sphingomonas sp.]|nr:hypothetical protein [Sphingomonas sp.]
MSRKFFTKVSPKAVEGIRRAYPQAEVRAKMGGDGTATVVVTTGGDAKRPAFAA